MGYSPTLSVLVGLVLSLFLLSLSRSLCTVLDFILGGLLATTG